MTPRERCLSALNHAETDRIPVTDTVWPTTEERWHREGLPAGRSSFDYFGYERVAQGADIGFQFPAQTLGETEDYRIALDTNGATTKVFKRHESVPETLGFTIDSRRAWEEHKPRLVWNDARVGWEGGLLPIGRGGSAGCLSPILAKV